jgi:hypothetical protein
VAQLWLFPPELCHALQPRTRLQLTVDTRCCENAQGIRLRIALVENGRNQEGPTLFKFLILVEMVSAEGIEPSTY